MNKEDLEKLKAVIERRETKWKAKTKKAQAWLQRNWIQTTVVVLSVILLLSFCAGGN